MKLGECYSKCMQNCMRKKSLGSALGKKKKKKVRVVIKKWSHWTPYSAVIHASTVLSKQLVTQWRQCWDHLQAPVNCGSSAPAVQSLPFFLAYHHDNCVNGSVLLCCSFPLSACTNWLFATYPVVCFSDWALKCNLQMGSKWVLIKQITGERHKNP